MQNLHDDKHLDRLSRDAAENFQPDATLHSWDQLKAGLDRELPEKKEKKRRLIFILFLFMLVGGGIVTSALWLNSHKTQPKAGVTDAGDKPSASGPVNDKTSPGNNPDVTKQLPVAPGSASGTTATPPVTKPQASVDVVTNNVVTMRVNAGRKKQSAPENNQATDTEDKIVSGKVVTDKTVAEDKAVTEDKVVTDNTTAPKKEEPTVAEDKPVTEDKSSTAKAKVTSTSRNPSVAASRWEFGAVYAPDISTVKFTHTQKPGTNVGLTVGYNISRRFAVQAGAIYTIKNYKSRGKDYHPPKGYWTDYVKLETVTADCDMWDIPINLRYNLVPKHRSNLFVTTGLSSYLMRSEDYNFFYYYNNNPVNRYREYETNSQHWFSVLNLSVGYERQINKSFAVQVEPFFKQPLKGVGFGNVKLNSTGIFFSVKYKPVSKPRR